jgi:hypothetical protein
MAPLQGKGFNVHKYSNVSAPRTLAFNLGVWIPPSSSASHGEQDRTLVCGVHHSWLDTIESHVGLGHQTVLVIPAISTRPGQCWPVSRCPRMRAGAIPARNKASHRAWVSIIGLSWSRIGDGSIGPRSSTDLQCALYHSEILYFHEYSA